jgi:uroporphyrinogen-III synthase
MQSGQPHLLLTRPVVQARDFAEYLLEYGKKKFDVTYSPLFEINMLQADIEFSDVQALLFTSANGVRAFVHQYRAVNMQAFCVGQTTAKIARDSGFAAISADGDVAALADLAVELYQPGAGHYLHVRGAKTTGDLIGRLRKMRVRTDQVVLYEQTPLKLTPVALELLASYKVILPLFSPRTARLFAQEVSAIDLVGVTAVCISESTRQPLLQLTGCTCVIAPVPTRVAMRQAIMQLA